MGNCQAAEAATVVIQHPGNKVERFYWSVSANEVMSSNPGHYVALIINSPTARSENGQPVRQLKLLRPDDTLLMGQVYRLVSFEDVLKEFAAKKSVKLGRLLKESGGLVLDSSKKNSPAPNPKLVQGGSLVKVNLHKLLNQSSKLSNFN
ncbi:OLC1v1011436C2 [Oldenlandia corymbosa var. corymbosa]|uniref:OLC1v1011436C2 n=1 Tax=Oldenlandia corymbosa var. corymbosa TaxID=529605 RepID=A0AAV1DWY9_OLDCO|nr:OLC1v1011436C2 [Oldenlandia corymbosa var. corymbosa]